MHRQKWITHEKEKTPPSSESEESKRLRQELKEAKLALYQEKMRADAYNTMIKVAEEMFRIPIRKKADTKQ